MAVTSFSGTFLENVETTVHVLFTKHVRNKNLIKFNCPITLALWGVLFNIITLA